MATLAWGPVSASDLPALQKLATSCLRRDGGLPQLSGEAMLTSMFLSGESLAGRDELGELVAVIGLFRDGEGNLNVTGLVHPQYRGIGFGEELVKWAREHADGAPLRIIAETTSPESNTLYAAAGLTRTFAETVMRHNLKRLPIVPRPAGVSVLPFRDDTAALFYTAYRRSFAERPGFADMPEEQWITSMCEDEEFLPEHSRVALSQVDEPVGFVTVSRDWIDQVGVVPEFRGRALGAHLVARSLTALQRAGSEEVWLCVNVDNPARALYERLGFKSRGTRARYIDRVRLAEQAGVE
jgi:mycothiol synthase